MRFDISSVIFINLSSYLIALRPITQLILQLASPASVKPSIAELNGATIVLNEASEGEAEPEGSTLDISPMVL